MRRGRSSRLARHAAVDIVSSGVTSLLHSSRLHIDSDVSDLGSVSVCSYSCDDVSNVRHLSRFNSRCRACFIKGLITVTTRNRLLLSGYTDYIYIVICLMKNLNVI